jgi:hypothetical protein
LSAAASSREKAALFPEVVDAASRERARAKPARSSGFGGCFLPCGANRLRVFASHQFACA